MVQKVRQQLGVKLFALMTVLILLALVPLTYVVFSTITYFGNYTTEINREQIKKHARAYLATIAKEQAHKHDAFFSHVEVASSLMAAQATEIYNNIDYYADFPKERLGLGQAVVQGEGQFLHSANLILAFRGEKPVTPTVSKELQALSRLEPVLKGIRQEIPQSISAHLETVTGISCYSAEIRGQTPDYISRYRPPHNEVLLADAFSLYQSSETGLGQTVWTGSNLSGYGDSLIISARSPVVDAKGKLRGVAGIDIPLARVVNDILEAEPQRAGDHQAETLFSFIVDRYGNVVVFPRKYFSLFGIAPEKKTRTGPPAVLSFNLAHSTSSQIATALPSLLKGQESTFEVKLDNEQYILNMHTMHQLDWHLVLVTREAELTASVSKTQQALAGTIEQLAHKFIANAFLIVLSILVIAFIAVAYFVAPLKNLSEAAINVGKGDLQTRCYLKRSDELGTLADSFNSMVRQLEVAEKNKKNHAYQLEMTVTERTRDLRNKNYMLRDVINELRKASERRRIAVEALKRSEEQLKESKSRLQESLAEKEVLLREIYHRTKNNMLVIISMLHLQAMEVEDGRMKELFRETENRIRAMALVHEKLYQSQNLVEVDLGQYLDKMVTSLVSSMVIDNRIEVESECSRILVSIDTILPLGLAVNEIVTNSLKHGFPDGRKGLVSIRVVTDADGTVEIVVADDGIGVPDEIDIHKVRSLGMQITLNLVEKQLRGTMSMNRTNGTTYSIRFKESSRPQRI